MEEAKVEVVLKTRHEHMGEVKNAGDVLSVYPDQANWLFERDIAVRPSARKSTVTGGRVEGSK